ncbi:MAG: S8 family serine peptidase [Xanthomonadales bacterium]|nr:S8 family serine peptidase [Xanthomonadales bacterium]
MSTRTLSAPWHRLLCAGFATLLALPGAVLATPSIEHGRLDFYTRNGARAQEDGTIIDQNGRQVFLLPLKEMLSTRNGEREPYDASGVSTSHLDALAEEAGLAAAQVAQLSDELAAAFLDDRQFVALASRTKSGDLIPDRLLDFSGIWADSTSGFTLLPWGVQAVAGGQPSTRTHTLYVIDSGVHNHDSLHLEKQDRLAVLGLPVVTVCNAAPEYAHGTHIAGIIAGLGSPGGVTGVRPNARIVSINVALPDICKATTASVVAGLEMARKQILLSAAQPRTAVVNLSINPDREQDPAGAGLIDNAMRNVAFPATAYPGAFIAQSAGNHGNDACQHAYRPPNTNWALDNDGIMVVAAIDRNGQAARPLWHQNPPLQGFHIPRFGGQGTESETGNNGGLCVDTMAPGVDVVSTWSGNTLSRSSGTSFAAPHVAALALYALESGLAATPAAVEQWLRGNHRFLYGSNLVIPALQWGVFLTKPSIVFYTKLEERNDAGDVGYLSTAAWHKSEEVHATSPASFRTFSDSYLTVGFAVDDATGLLPCTARVFRNGVLAQPGALPPPTVYANGSTGRWDVAASHWLQLEGSTIRLQVDCPSGTGGWWPDGQSSVTVELQTTPKPVWHAAAPSTGGGQLLLSRRASPTHPAFSGTPDVHWTTASPWLEQGFSAPGAHSCQRKSYRIPSNPDFYGAADLLYQYAVQGAFQPVVRYEPMPDQATGLPGLGAPWIGRGYRWLVTCWNDVTGHHPQATSIRSVEMTGKRN